MGKLGKYFTASVAASIVVGLSLSGCSDKNDEKVTKNLDNNYSVSKINEKSEIYDDEVEMQR